MIESLAERVKERLYWGFYPSPLPVVTCAASLAHHGLLGSMDWMVLRDVDLTSVPAEHLASLASSVIGRVYINNVSGCDLVTILDSVKCKFSSIISGRSLSSEETQALAQILESQGEMQGGGV